MKNEKPFADDADTLLLRLDLNNLSLYDSPCGTKLRVDGNQGRSIAPADCVVKLLRLILIHDGLE